MSKKLAKCHSIEDLHQLARKKVPRVMLDYMEGGAEDEVTLDWNIRSFDKYEFIPRTLVDVGEIDLSTKVQGVNINLPVISAPTGMTRMFHHEGEIAVVKASHKAGTAYCLSTVSTSSIEDVANTSDGPRFFQIYAWRDEKMVDDFIERCKKSGYNGLMLAVDVPVLGKRERDLKNGHGTKALRINMAKSALKKPAWLYNFITKPTWRMANMINHLPGGAKMADVVDDVNNQFDPSVTWEKAAAIRKKWDGPFLLKGIQSVDDTKKALEIGCTGVVLSNHGGRQLDGAPAAFDLLPDVVEAVGDQMEVIIDGGIRRGSDVVKAVALGAKAVLIGRAYLYGLGAGGEKGVDRTYEILQSEIQKTMQLIGCKSISELDTSFVKRR